MTLISESPARRQRLDNRRTSTTFNFECNGLAYSATVSYFPDGRLAEIFIGNQKAGSHGDAAAKDSAVIASIALQFGVPLETIRRALLRDSHDPIGAALDLVAESSRC